MQQPETTTEKAGQVISEFAQRMSLQADEELRQIAQVHVELIEDLTTASPLTLVGAPIKYFGSLAFLAADSTVERLNIVTDAPSDFAFLLAGESDESHERVETADTSAEVDEPQQAIGERTEQVQERLAA